MTDSMLETSVDLTRVLANARVCFFDCDGVVFDSNGFKVQAMLRVLRNYPEEQRASMRSYWRDNGGMSRNAKFRHFFESIADGVTADAELAESVRAAVAEFGRYSLQGYSKLEPIPQALELARHVGRERSVIVSGAAQAELHEVFRCKGIDRLFSEILGSPTKKLDLVSDVLERRQIGPEEAFLIGDGARDFEVCQRLGLHFVYLDCYSEWEGARAALEGACERGLAVSWAADWPTLLKMLGV